MHRKAFFVIVSFLVLMLNDGASAQRREEKQPLSNVWNNNSLIDIQKQGGDPSRSGDVRIEFYGHDAFKVTSPAGLTVLSDPWRNDSTGSYPKWFLREFPAIQVDIALSSHAHFDHDAVQRPEGLMVLGRLMGKFKLGDIEITGLADKHKCDPTPADKQDKAPAGPSADTCPPNNVPALDNAIQMIETGGMRIAIWGDNRAMPDASLGHYLENVDVLILPVDSVLTRDEVDMILKKYSPKAVIPAHYYVTGLTSDASGLESADGWVDYLQKVHHADVHRLNKADFTLNTAKLKGAHQRVTSETTLRRNSDVDDDIIPTIPRGIGHGRRPMLCRRTEMRAKSPSHAEG